MASTQPAAAAVGAEKPQGPADINRDGIKVLDMSYYELLSLRADATDAQIKSAYKKAALKVGSSSLPYEYAATWAWPAVM